MHVFLFSSLLMWLTMGACQPATSTSDKASASVTAEFETTSITGKTASPYRFDAPSASFDMPAELFEISGLTLLNDKQLGAIQDELGNLYVLDIESGKLVKTIRFAGTGDYEGIERVGERLFVLRADGMVIELTGWQSGKIKPVAFDNDLGTKACNAEGLGADGKGLVIACKEDNKNGRNSMYLYALQAAGLGEATLVELDPAGVPGEKSLRPSAIAQHPITGDMILLSSKRELLIALGPKGEVKDTWDIKPAKLEQPEGLAFLPNGDLFISSEGKKGPGRVMRFAYRG